MSAYHDSLALLDFVNDPNSSLIKFLIDGNATSLPVIATDLTPDELKHEQAHAKVWSEINVSTTFHRDAGNNPFTAPNKEELISFIKESNMNKIQFLDFYSRVVSAPRDLEGLQLDGTDLRDSLILSREIKTREELALFEAGRS